MLSRISSIAKLVLHEAVHKKILMSIFLFGLIAIGFSTYFTYLTPNEEIKIIKDIGLGAITFFGMLVAIFGAATLIPSEIERRTAPLLLASPIRRSEVVLGKFLGAVMVIATNLIFMSALFFILLISKEQIFDTELLKAILIIFMKNCLLASVAIFFSTFLSSNLNVAASFSIYIIGHFLSFLSHIGEHAKSKVLEYIFVVLEALFPNFENFDIQNSIVLGTQVTWIYISKVLLYGLLYSAVMLMGAILIFNRREV
ncbi:MAG: ABC transporter permease subunit [Candidatus Omnitrophica bacterium]|nr:ABC transporter permease subunit [Candidatus Omnitrophota bacterium]